MPDDHTICCQLSRSEVVYEYDKCSSTRRIVIFGSSFSIIAGLGFIVFGVYIWVVASGLNPHHVHGLMYFKCHVPYEVPSIVLNLIVTACTECAGIMHATSLRFALFREHRATYNSNLRLVHGSDEKPMNSPTINTVMTVLLTISYASSSFLYRDIGQIIWPGTEACAVLAIPAIILGISIFLQTCISLFALRDTDILTWSTSPFDTIPALLSMHDHHTLEKHYPLPDRCACMSAIGMPPRPRRPLDRQPSAWDTRRGVRVSIYLLWSLGFACMVWGGWVYAVLPQDSDFSWRFIPSQDNYGEDAINGDYWLTQSGISFATWLSLYAAMVLTQGGLTLGLHCVEIVAAVVRDEMIWRRALSKDGINSSVNSWRYALSLDNWLHIVLLLSKPILREHLCDGLCALTYSRLRQTGYLVSVSR